MMKNTIFYVYQYVNEQGIPYYIGKGKENRIREKHRYTSIPPAEQRIIVKSNLTEDQAFELEMKLIRKYGRKVDGGLLDNIKLNQWACAIGWKHKPETVEKIRQGNLGKVRTEEHKQKYSIAKQKMSEETKQKIREANLGRKDDGRAIKSAETVKRKLLTDKEYAEKFWSMKKQQSKDRKGKPWSVARRASQNKKQELQGLAL